ncbi:hypothetical protein [Desulforamulus hydrothermalis]|uniref:Secretin/TonB short N-terminal domain-containing protein n=1 Tax=Desulforamulus hydrothermalis Lam5 = DSM 18033 TaxID=1121428 RepID=K8EB85_9FIRM|nr:hypothetical protein [Desulforamulus hydrothermalis]CCO08888.1 conserved exported hypothetical protein [Desulforamulus hydrothermalis Lam5 = DSM 18033]SHG74033.1 type IV pilus assembly protein PilQ [Desulforamulus hydrothermalis Lam5 = DSM 18033]
MPGKTAGLNSRHRFKACLNKLLIIVWLAGSLGPAGAAAASDAAAGTGYPALAEAAYDIGSMNMDVRDADLRDVLSALAVKMGVNILLLDTEPEPVTFRAYRVTPRLAMELIIQSKGLAYLQKGDIIVVGPPDTLLRDFFDQLVLTRFDTNYIKTDKLKSMLSELGIQGVKSVVLDTNPHVIWVQGTAAGLKKVKEVIASVDIPEQAEEDDKTRFVYKLTYIVAEDAAKRLEKFGFPDVQTITTDGDRYGHEIMVICPKKIETQVKSALNSLDMPRQKTKAPLITAKGDYAHQALASARDLLSQLSGVPVGNMSISRNLGTSKSPAHVLWVEETPDKIRLLRDLIQEMDLGDMSSQESSD